MTLLTTAGAEAVRTLTADPDALGSALTRLMGHGGLYAFLDGGGDALADRIDPDSPAAARLADAARAAGRTVPAFFSHLVDAPPCPVPSALMSYLTFPHEGVVFSRGQQEEAHPERFESPDVPAAFTFVGQFVDHDLTLNAVNLVEPQTGQVVDQASPVIDLDSVYGPRAVLSSPRADIFDGPRFRLTHPEPGVVDLPRLTAPGSRPAVIADARNDENQMILQIHLLLQRLHNRFVDQGHPFAEARRRTILNWQSVLLHDYLPRIVRGDVLAGVLAALAHEPYRGIKHRPGRLPHEFAIGFRMGHSQLRRAYKVNRGAPVRLFDHLLGDAGPVFDDLRGSQVLTKAHTIDWPVFLPLRSNAIDRKVTSVVFDLPESAVPDDIKYIGNLPQRNLIRSRQVGLCAGEDLAALYGVPPLTPAEVEPDPDRRHLFGEGGTFRTPLWYYLLAEAARYAEPGHNPRTLGPAGSHLVAEVVAGGVRYAELNLWTAGDPGTWSLRAGHPHPEAVRLADIVAAVTG